MPVNIIIKPIENNPTFSDLKLSIKKTLPKKIKIEIGIKDLINFSKKFI